ncbi:MAG: hypothetical protein GXY67_10455 [Clostridiales bacterium]|nr:hypothetical protein [Clostridiales bacterium]
MSQMTKKEENNYKESVIKEIVEVLRGISSADALMRVFYLAKRLLENESS